MLSISMPSYKPCIKITALGERFYDRVMSAQFPETILRYRNDQAARSVGLDGLSDKKWIDHFGRFQPLKNNFKQPLALRYHGHQFRHYNPDLGDGRGFLFAQMRGERGRLLDLGTKGSGQTPWSRAGDGRLTLLGGVREVLATSYLSALGVNTSKSLSLIETGEKLMRSDEPSPARSAVLVRLSHSHIRFGTFQRAAFEHNKEGMETLVSYCLEHFYPNAKQSPSGLLADVTKSSAQTVASWMAAGFVHGVMNTDNMNITGESFDYGPFRFSPALQSSRTAAYFDHQGLYAFGRQPETMYWNLGQLASALSLIDDGRLLAEAIEGFACSYRASLRAAVLKRMGIKPSKDEAADLQFISQTFNFLEGSQAGLAQFYFDVYGGAQTARLGAYEGQSFDDWLAIYKTYEGAELRPETDKAVSLTHSDIEKLWEPITRHDDWSLFKKKIADMHLVI